MKTTVTITLEIEHDEDVDVTGIVDRVLDSGTVQDAIAEYASDHGESVEILDATTRPAHAGHDEAPCIVCGMVSAGNTCCPPDKDHQ